MSGSGGCLLYTFPPVSTVVACSQAAREFVKAGVTMVGAWTGPLRQAYETDSRQHAITSRWPSRQHGHVYPVTRFCYVNILHVFHNSRVPLACHRTACRIEPFKRCDTAVEHSLLAEYRCLSSTAPCEASRVTHELMNGGNSAALPERQTVMKMAIPEHFELYLRVRMLTVPAHVWRFVLERQLQSRDVSNLTEIELALWRAEST